MKFAQFYNLSTGYDAATKDYTGERALIIACGSDSVFVLDGRWNKWRQRQEAAKACKARGYLGYSLHAGETFTRSREVWPLEKI